MPQTTCNWCRSPDPRPAHEGVHTAKVKVPLVVRVGVGTDSQRVGQVRACIVMAS